MAQLEADHNLIFQVNQRKDVLDFVKANPAVLPLIKEAIPRIREKFGEDVDFGLEVFHEEFHDDEPMLFLKILSDLTVAEEMKRFKDLCFEWWLAAGQSVGSKLNITPASRLKRHENISMGQLLDHCRGVIS